LGLGLVGARARVGARTRVAPIFTTNEPLTALTGTHSSSNCTSKPPSKNVRVSFYVKARASGRVMVMLICDLFLESFVILALQEDGEAFIVQ